MKKSLLLLLVFGFFVSGSCLGADNCICLVTNGYPFVTGAWGTKSIRIASMNIITPQKSINNCLEQVCPGDYEYSYYKTDKSIIENGLSRFIENTPNEIDSFCNQFESSFSKEKCKEAVEQKKNTDEYKESLNRYNEKEEAKKKQAELEAKQKELEEKQAELEAKQKELEEENEKLKQQQEKDSQIEETTSKIVEELNKTEEKVMTEEVSKAKEGLGNKAVIFDSLVPLFKAKDQKTQENVKALLKTFTQSKDEYTRNIGIYFGYLVE